MKKDIEDFFANINDFEKMTLDERTIWLYVMLEKIYLLIKENE